MTRRWLIPWFLLPLLVASAPAAHVPAIDELLSVWTIGEAQISPDGRWVAYTVNRADFKQDAFVAQIWLADVPAGRIFQLTRGEKSASRPAWAPGGEWLAFTSDRAGGKAQIFAIRPGGGEAIQLTKAETGVRSFAWSPDGKQIAFTASEPDSQQSKDRKEYFGDYRVVRGEYNYVHLWTIPVADAMKAPEPGTQRTRGSDFSVGSFDWSPDASRIAFSATVNPDLVQSHTSDIYLLDLSAGKATRIVSQDGPDTSPHWSPDGKRIVFSSYLGNPRYNAHNSRLAVVAVDGGPVASLTDGFDENPGFVEWNGDGIYFSALQKTASHLFHLDPGSRAIHRVTGPEGFMGQSFSLTRDGQNLAFTAASPTSLNEVYVTGMKSFVPKKLTDSTEQAKDFILGTREVISWKSSDGTLIEGILIKPADFDPGRKYPLLCVIHGGPTGVDRPALLTPDTRYYPSDIWAGRGALILKVNYRGSAGYGEKFRKLNERNLGVGDSWDVLSGIDDLIRRGWVDKDKVACMGWSQGGYISAFLTTSSDRFAAISVGAGISNWATYYYNTDITHFTINYLGDNPAADPEIYRKTSPMTYIRQARTPTLIQHGELDRRVPIPNAYELRQGLVDQGVPVQMIVYTGYGHGITKPKSIRAVMQHNLDWFNHYLWGDPAPDFAKPLVPDPKSEKETGNQADGSN